MVIKAQQYRTQEKNRDDALKRLQLMVRKVGVIPRETKIDPPYPWFPAKNAWIEKPSEGRTKTLRQKVTI